MAEFPASAPAGHFPVAACGVICDYLRDPRSLVAFASTCKDARDAVKEAQLSWIIRHYAGDKHKTLVAAARMGILLLFKKVYSLLKVNTLWIGDALLAAAKLGHADIVSWIFFQRPEYIQISGQDVVDMAVFTWCERVRTWVNS